MEEIKSVDYACELKEKNKKQARELFAHHVATMKENDDVIIIDWKEPDNGHIHWIRYLFEKDEYRLTISGDFGDCTVWNGYGGSNVCIEEIHQFFNYPDYFIEKIRSHMENNLFSYDEYLAALQLEEKLEWVTDHDLYKYTMYYTDKESFIDDLLDEYTITGFRDLSSSDVGQELKRLDDDTYFEILSFGKVISKNIYLYLEGLHMAMQQLHIGVYKSERGDDNE